MNAPGYHLLMWLWARVAGVSDAALRAPSLLASALAPVVAVRWPPPGLVRSERLAWAALLGFWFPALSFAQEARAYALLGLIAAAQTAAFARLIAAPTLRRAAVWCGLAAVAGLMHYYALAVGLAQGVIYLALHRRRAAATWPAALLLTPVAGALAWQASRLAVFAAPQDNWFARLGVKDAPAIAAMLAGSPVLVAPCAAVLLVALLGRGRAARPGPAAWAALASLAGASLIVTLGVLRPSVTPRYLTPCAPGLLLGLTLACRGLPPWSVRPARGVLPTLFAVVGLLELHAGLRQSPKVFSFEAASADLARRGADRVIFIWDNPTAATVPPQQLQAVGSFFFDRAHAAVAVSAPQADGRGRALTVGAPRANDGVIWLEDTRVRPPVPAPKLDPALRCANHGGGPFRVLACMRPPPT